MRPRDVPYLLVFRAVVNSGNNYSLLVPNSKFHLCDTDKLSTIKIKKGVENEKIPVLNYVGCYIDCVQ